MRPPEDITFSDRVALIPPMPFVLRGLFMPHTSGTNYQPYGKYERGSWVTAGEELLWFSSLGGWITRGVQAALKSPAPGLVMYPLWNTSAADNGDSQAYANDGDGHTAADDRHYAFALLLPSRAELPLTAESVYGTLCDVLPWQHMLVFTTRDATPH